MINVREWALPVYTILLQMAAGALFVLWIIYTITAYRQGPKVADSISRNLVLVISCTILAAMIGSHFHLSRPYISITSIVNFQTSWLSREIIFTILFLLSTGSLGYFQWRKKGALTQRIALGWFAVWCGWMSVYAMSRVYMLEAQPAWNLPSTIILFVTTSLVLGAVAVITLLIMNIYFRELQDEDQFDIQLRTIQQALWWGTLAVILCVAVEVVTTLIQTNVLLHGDMISQTSAGLLMGLYRPIYIMRLVLAGVGALSLVLIVLWQRKLDKPLVALMQPLIIVCLVVLSSEVLGRFLFYATHVRVGI